MERFKKRVQRADGVGPSAKRERNSSNDMIVSIMQPYLFPYIGFFQLMSSCDLFVIYDDVQYIKGGWINRNKILIDGEPQWITLPVANADFHLPINQRDYLLNDRLVPRFRRRIVGAYASAPYFDKVMPVIDEILRLDDSNVARFNTHQLRKLASYIGIEPKIQISSSIDKVDGLTGQGRVIDLCKKLGAQIYVNPIGGVELYQPERFRERGIELRFLKSAASGYQQFNDNPIGSLSIIDVLMFNDLNTIKVMLSQCSLITNRHEALAGSSLGYP